MGPDERQSRGRLRVKLGGKGTFSTRPVIHNDRTLPVPTVHTDLESYRGSWGLLRDVRGSSVRLSPVSALPVERTNAQPVTADGLGLLVLFEFYRRL